MKIIIIEPFYTGSHKSWIEGYKKSSNHNIRVISLPGRFWKWRMHGGAITLAKKYQNCKFNPDLILASDMLNLPVFKSLIKATCPIGLYFHENQFTYPWSPNDTDPELQRDKHYGFINYSSALSADHNYFNSQFHFDSFIYGLEKFLRQFPDYREIQNIEKIISKSSIMYLGMDLQKFDPFLTNNNNKPKIILWNHRWEYDKNPDQFFEVMQNLSKNNIDFQLAVLGKEFKDENLCFTNAKKNLKKHIIHFGYTPSFADYANWLCKADILPITSNQDFFGASIMEAVYCRTIPLLPNRLTYPELFDKQKNSELFYINSNDLINKIEKLLTKETAIENDSLHNIAKKFDWNDMAKYYDEKLEQLI